MAQMPRTISIKITLDVRQFNAQLVKTLGVLAAIEAQRDPWRDDYAEVE